VVVVLEAAGAGVTFTGVPIRLDEEVDAPRGSKSTEDEEAPRGSKPVVDEEADGTAAGSGTLLPQPFPPPFLQLLALISYFHRHCLLIIIHLKTEIYQKKNSSKKKRRN